MNNPFVGPRPLRRREDRLHGRRREVERLFHLLVAERVVWFYSPSGAGKTSLVEAGLIPRLEAEDFHVWPVIRVRALSAAGPGDELGSENRYVASVLASLGEELPESEVSGALAELVTRRRRSINEEACVVLVFDQFEEILTLDPLDEDGRRRFFNELGEVLEDRYVWALFVLREEHWAALRPYLTVLAGRRMQTMRLELLNRAAAREAMVEPVRAAGKDLPDVDGLVDDLATMRVQQTDGSLISRPGQFVEPVYLQVVCRRLWQATPADERLVRLKPGAELGDVDGVLAAFYDHELTGVAAARSVSEHTLRRWVGEQLITPGGLRAQVLREGGSCSGLDGGIVEALCDVHLLRAERRAGRTWYELAHDRLVGPVRQANEAWFENHLIEAQRRTLLWVAGGHTPDLLLRGEALERAEKWAAQPRPSLTDSERRFLAESRHSEDLEQRQRRQTRRIRLLGRLATTIGALACGIAVFAGWGWQQALAARTEVQRGLARVYERDALAAEDPRRAQAFFAESLNLDPDHLATRFQLSAALASLEAVTPLEPLRHERPLDDAVFSPDGLWVASAAGERLTLWHAATGIRAWSRSHPGLLKIVFSTDGRDLLAVSRDGSIDRYGDWRSHPLRRSGQHLDTAVDQLHSSHDGRRLMTVGPRGQLRMWEIERGMLVGQFETAGLDTVDAVFDATDRFLATGTRRGRIQIWDWRVGEQVLAFQAGDRAVRHVAFDAAGELLVTALDDNTIRVWRMSGEQLGQTLPDEFGFDLAAFGPRDGTVVGVTAGGTVEFWDWQKGERLEVLARHEGKVVGLQISPDRRRILSASRDQTITVRAPVREHVPEVVRRPLHGVSVARFSADGRKLVSLSADRRQVQVWDDRGEKLSEPLRLSTEADDVSFRSAGERLWVTSTPGTGQVWDWRRGQVVAEMDKQGEPPWNDHQAGDLVVTISEGAARLWETESGRPVGEPLGHGGSWVKTAAFSSDGRWVVTAGEDGTARLWDATSGRSIRSPLGHDEPLSSAFFDARGERVVTACEDGALRVWKIGTPQSDIESEWLANLVHTVAGWRVDGVGALEPITAGERHQRLVELAQQSRDCSRWPALMNDFRDCSTTDEPAEEDNDERENQ